MSLEVVIIDDEPKAIELLRHYIIDLEQLEVKQTFGNALKAFQYLSKEQVDLIFLDINMPQLSGLDLFKNLRNPPKVIFTTAHAKYAIDGFELDAVDYLLKPISFSRFLKAIQKLDKLYLKKNAVDTLTVDSLFIKSGATEHKILWREISYLEKSENYVIFHLMNGQRILNRGTLSDLEKIFPSYIVRIHKSFAVCLSNIISTKTNSVLVPGSGQSSGQKSTHDAVDKSEIPIGRTYKSDFRKYYQDHKSTIL